MTVSSWSYQNIISQSNTSHNKKNDAVQKTNPEKVVTLEIPHRIMCNSVEQAAKWRNHILFTGRAYNTEHIFLQLPTSKGLGVNILLAVKDEFSIEKNLVAPHINVVWTFMDYEPERYGHLVWSRLPVLYLRILWLFGEIFHRDFSFFVFLWEKIFLELEIFRKETSSATFIKEFEEMEIKI